MSHKVYTLAGPTNEGDYQSYQLYEHDDGGIFGDGRRATPTATIHVGSNGAYIMASSTPNGVRATDFDHAVTFCTDLLGITKLLTAPSA